MRQLGHSGSCTLCAAQRSWKLSSGAQLGFSGALSNRRHVATQPALIDVRTAAKFSNALLPTSAGRGSWAVQVRLRLDAQRTSVKTNMSES